MIRGSCLLMMLFAVGCGGGEPAKNPTAEKPGNPGSAPNPAKLNEEEAKLCITEYFSRLGLSNLELVAISHAVETPAESGAGWAYSVTLKCDNVFGDKMSHNHWLVVVGVENGKMTVKTHYDTMSKIMESPLGKDWFAKAGFSEPMAGHVPGLPMPAELLPLTIVKPEPMSGSVQPAGFPLPDLPPPPALPPFQIPKN